MLRTQDGSPDGVRVLSYVKGLEYPAAGFPLSVDLRDVFLREGWAEEAGSPSPTTTSAQEPAASVSDPAKRIIVPPPPPDAPVRCCPEMTTAVPDDSRAAGITYCPKHGRHPNPAAFQPEPCAAVSPIGEPCIATGEHTEHEWVPLPPPKRRGRRTGGV